MTSFVYGNPTGVAAKIMNNTQITPNIDDMVLALWNLFKIGNFKQQQKRVRKNENKLKCDRNLQ